MHRPADDGKPARPPAGRRRWTSFIADESAGDKPVRGLHEATNPKHRLRVAQHERQADAARRAYDALYEQKPLRHDSR